MHSDMFTQPTGTDREPRLLDPEELALLCKLQRQWRGWSQETLAELSGLTVRTVQRVEAGDRVGPETRRALARAWGAPDINCLNTPTVFPTTEEIQAAEEKRLAELAKNYHLVDVVPSNGRAIARAVRGTQAHMAVLADGLEQDRSVEDIFAGLSDYVRDLGDIADEVSSSELLSYGDELQSMIVQLAQRGVTIMIGSKPMCFAPALHCEAAETTLTVLYVFGAKKGHEPKQLHVDKRMAPRFA